MTNSLLQGCCASTPRSSAPPPPAEQAPPQSSHSSRHPIASQPPPQSLSQVFNAPLKPHYWAPKDRRWKQTELDTERTSFWDTRVTARPEIWASLHLVCQSLSEIPACTIRTILSPPYNQEDDRRIIGARENLRNAQAIIDAAGITLPTGDLVDGAYDGWGNHYVLPAWVVAQPDGLVEGEGVVENFGESLRRELTSRGGGGEEVGPAVVEGSGDGSNPVGNGITDEDDIALLKGKGKLADDLLFEVEKEKKGTITVKCRLSDGRQDIVVKMPRASPVRELSQKLAKIAEVCFSSR